MQVVAVSITDNSALLNANVGTSFFRADDGFDRATRGHTPADLALVGSNSDLGFNWRVGFFDNPANLPGNPSVDPWIEYDHTRFWPIVNWNPALWKDNFESSFLDELGIEGGTNLPGDANPIFAGALNATNDVTSRYGRLWYWRLAGKDPFNAKFGFRPFTLADELELRSYEGNNNQYVASRFEVALNNPANDLTFQLLRSSYDNAHEATELRDQLTNHQLVFDNRRKLTMFNGVRNDLLPPWLRWEDRFWDRHSVNIPDLPEGREAFDFNTYFRLYGFTTGLAYLGAGLPTKVSLEITRALLDGCQIQVDDW